MTKTSVRRALTRFALCGIVGIRAVLAAPGPQTIGFMGLLSAATGARQNGSVDVTLTLYPDATGGSPVWTENQTVVVSNGLFSTALGKVTTFPSSLDFSQAYFVGIKVKGDAAELTPRIPLQGVPYALFARSVADNTVSSAKLTSDSASLAKVSGGALHTDATNVGIDRAARFGMNPSDSFSYNSQTMSHYGLGWFADSWNGYGSTAWISGYGGVKLFTNGQPQVSLDQTGRLGVGADVPQAKLDVRGDIRLGSTGQYFAPSGDQNLSIQYGTVNADGTAGAGSTFSAGKIGTGAYSLVFPGWGATPYQASLVITPYSFAAGPPNSNPASLDIVARTTIETQYVNSAGYLNYIVRLTSGGAPFDSPFTVVLIRPR